VAAYLVREKLDRIIYCHIEEQHPDTIRFLNDCEKLLGKNIEVLQSPYKSVEKVIDSQRFINGPGGAACTNLLKKRVRKDWERKNNDGNLIYIWGYDVNEKHRAERIEESMPEYQHEFPLIDKLMTKEDCHAIANRLGLKRPMMYDLGYRNNNCIGCVKGSMWYWNKIRQDFPETFALRAKQEREIGHSCIKDCFLDELKPGQGKPQDEVSEDCGFACIMTVGY
jgi:predicted transposase YbfD/YdcC